MASNIASINTGANISGYVTDYHMGTNTYTKSTPSKAHIIVYFCAGATKFYSDGIFMAASNTITDSSFINNMKITSITDTSITYLQNVTAGACYLFALY